MTVWQRNFPAPLKITIHSDAGFSARGPIVVEVCEKINELQEFVFGLDTSLISVPSQAAGSDERMPLMYLRPCIEAVNFIIEIKELPLRPLPQLGNNMDYHAFIPVCKVIAEAINLIIQELQNGQAE
jgi:hypothetical protein